MEGIGKLEIKKFAGSERKRDARTGIYYRITPRKVLKVTVADNFKKIMNVDRKQSEPIDEPE